MLRLKLLPFGIKVNIQMGAESTVFSRLREIRGSRSTNQLADELGTYSGTVSRYENGRMPSAEYLQRLAEKGYSADWILTGSGSMLLDPGREGPTALTSLLSQIETQLALHPQDRVLAALRSIVGSGYLSTEDGPGGLEVLAALCGTLLGQEPSEKSATPAGKTAARRRA